MEIEIPDVFDYFFERGKWRYKGAHGGRGSAKSHSVASALVILGRMEPLTILCCREIQNSIKDSVKKLIDNKIAHYGFTDFYDSTDKAIVGKNGTSFIFKGLWSNVDSVKSMEDLDIAWIEEGQSVSANSLEVLTPTLRNEDSEIWATWNPRFEDDPIDVLFRKELPPRSICREVNYEQNPFFPKVLAEQMEWDKRRNPDKYAHVWRGGYKKNSEARVFKNWCVKEFEVPAKADHFIQGADWGFSVDPSVLVQGFIVGRTLYVAYEAYRIGCEIDDLPKLFAGVEGATTEEKSKWGIGHEALWPGVPNAKRWKIVADSARPETISYMKRAGFRIESANKGKGSVEDGIEFLQNYDIVVHPRCINTIDELSFYSWKVDKKTGNILPELEDKKNHVIDSLRYAVEGVRKGGALWSKLGKQ